jgi:hypothetical protein
LSIERLFLLAPVPLLFAAASIPLAASCVNSEGSTLFRQAASGGPDAGMQGGTDAGVDAPATTVVIVQTPCTDSGTTAPATTPSPGPYSWQNAVILGGGYVSGIEFSRAPVCNGALYARTDVGGAYRWDWNPAAPSTGVWTPITDWVGRAQSNLTGIESIAPDPVDPDIVYVAAGQYLGSNGVVLSSNDRGASWTQNAIGAQMGGNADGRNMGERLAVDPNLTSTLYFGSRTSGLWRSVDSATTWSQVASFPAVGDQMVNGTSYGLSFVLFDPRSGSSGAATPTIYVGVATGVATTDATASTLYRSKDAGATWQPVPGEPTAMFPHHAAVDSSGILYFTYNDWYGPNSISAGAVWKLDPSSDAWTKITPVQAGGGYSGISADPSRPGTLVVTSLDRWPDEIYRTTNGGSSWQAIGPTATRNPGDAVWVDWHMSTPSATGWMSDIEIDPHDPDRVLYNTGQGVWWSENLTGADHSDPASANAGPTTWDFQDQGLEETVATALISPSSGTAHLLSGVGDIGGFWHSDLTVSPATGMFDPIFGSTSGLDYAESNPSTVVRVGTLGSDNKSCHGAYSMDGGQTWTAFPTEPLGITTGAGSVAVSADGGVFVWAPQSGAANRDGGTTVVAAAYSVDQGKTWTTSNGLPAGAQVASDRVNPAKFYATSRSQLYLSTDGGATFVPSPATLARLGPPRPIFGTEGDVWITTGGSLVHSTDSGMTFATVASVQNAFAIGFGAPSTAGGYPSLYLSGQPTGGDAGATDPGVYRSDDEAMTWTRVDDPQHQFGVISYIAGDPRIAGRVYLGTGGRGILYGDPSQ